MYNSFHGSADESHFFGCGEGVSYTAAKVVSFRFPEIFQMNKWRVLFLYLIIGISMKNLNFLMI